MFPRTAAATTAATQITTRRTADSWHKETLRDKEPTRETNVELREENQKERVIGEYSCSLVALPVFERVRLFSMRLLYQRKEQKTGYCCGGLLGWRLGGEDCIHRRVRTAIALPVFLGLGPLFRSPPIGLVERGPSVPFPLALLGLRLLSVLGSLYALVHLLLLHDYGWCHCVVRFVLLRMVLL